MGPLLPQLPYSLAQQVTRVCKGSCHLLFLKPPGSNPMSAYCCAHGFPRRMVDSPRKSRRCHFPHLFHFFLPPCPLAALPSMWDLSSPTRDRTLTPCIGSAKACPLEHQRSPHSFFSVLITGGVTRPAHWSPFNPPPGSSLTTSKSCWKVGSQAMSKCAKKLRASHRCAVGPSQVAQWQRICGQCRRHKRWGFSPWVGKIPWSRKG